MKSGSDGCERQVSGIDSIDAVSMFIVTALSLLLLLYVGFGEGKRTYRASSSKSDEAQGYLIRIRSKIPARRLAAEAISRIYHRGAGGRRPVRSRRNGGVRCRRRELFLVKDKTNPQLPAPLCGDLARIKRDIEIDKGDTHYQVVVPLRTQFETAVPWSSCVETDVVAPPSAPRRFLPLLFLVVGLAAIFSIGITFAAPYLARTKVPWLQLRLACDVLPDGGALVYAGRSHF